jgi:hypothetical protein
VVVATPAGRLLRRCRDHLLVIFVCIASEGEAPEEAQEASRQERVCVSVAAPLMVGFGAAGLGLDRSARRRNTR